LTSLEGRAAVTSFDAVNGIVAVFALLQVDDQSLWSSKVQTAATIRTVENDAWVLTSTRRRHPSTSEILSQ